jgi:hypothetical protein
MTFFTQTFNVIKDEYIKTSIDNKIKLKQKVKMKTLIIILGFVALSQAVPLEFNSFGEIKNINKNDIDSIN